MKILVAEPIAQAGLDLLAQEPGWNVVQADPKTYQEHLADCDALIVRSAVKVNADLLRKAPRLRVVGRAGVGVDNVDLPAATNNGVLVMNTPGGNAISVAEHTLGLMLAMARAIPNASVSTKAGKWEKRKFIGTELRGKTLGVAGLGSIGREVVLRAKNFGMRIVASDPYVNAQQADDLGVALVDLPTLFASSDYITLHVALTPETTRMINRDTIARMKDGARVVNCARGELIDIDALVEGLASGKLSGAALDVFDPEPLPSGHPLFAQPNLIATPHIGGSTEEAQEIVGIRIAEQIAEYLKNGVAINAVNMPALSPEQYRALGPYIALAERLGTFASFISDSNPVTVRFTYTGKIAESNTSLVRNAGLSGLLARSLASRANLINAMQIAADRGLNINESHLHRNGHIDSIRIEVETSAGKTSVEGAMILNKPRLLSVDNIYCEAPLDGHLLYLKNLDVPGVIGYIGTVMGKNGINIANFSLGREDAAPEHGPAKATAIISCDGAVPDHVISQLLENPNIRQARNVEF
ncbi:MAG: phosphoglycerate dehydrogenase [Acidobacteriota bacterium]|jgi:D-3-phosphoglycerate dehydrogenase